VCGDKQQKTLLTPVGTYCMKQYFIMCIHADALDTLIGACNRQYSILKSNR